MIRANCTKDDTDRKMYFRINGRSMEILTERYEQAINNILDFLGRKPLNLLNPEVHIRTLDGIRTDRHLRRDPDGLAQMTCCPRR